VLEQYLLSLFGVLEILASLLEVKRQKQHIHDLNLSIMFTDRGYSSSELCKLFFVTKN
jgi:hypothetical protein